YATSVGSDVLRRINSQRAYSAGSGEFVRVTAQSYTRGPFDPSPQLSLCQASAGTPASNVPTRTCRNPAHTAKSARTPTTYPSPRPSTVVRKGQSHPYPAPPVTHFAGTPAATARSIIRRASTNLVANSSSSGTPASSRRPASWAHSLGRYSARSTNARPVFVAYPRNTPI